MKLYLRKIEPHHNSLLENTMKSVSIITVSQYSRFESLKNLYELILLQDYPNIIEWVIVEGSKTEEFKMANSKQIQEHFSEKDAKIKIRYITPTYILPLSDLRNLGNKECRGEIIVCMDDDDYYPKQRVSHAVERLNVSGLQIAGCSPVYMYDYFYEKLYKFEGYKNHSTNNCMAFTREYLETHRHKKGLHIAEETSFTNGFSESMVQLDPLKCIVVSSHGNNTFDKKILIEKMERDEIDNVYEINKPIANYIPKERFMKMRAVFSKTYIQ